MKKYQVINIETLEGLKKAEKLHTSGKWKIFQQSSWVIVFILKEKI